MNYFSTRDKSLKFSFKDIFLRGLAPGGGLFLPSEIKKYNQDELNGLSKLSYKELATEIIFNFCKDEVSKDDLKSLIVKSYNNFKDEEVVDLKKLGDINLLELYKGPTLAFKDIAMQVIGNLYEHLKVAKEKPVNIVVATSGDTGSAAIAALNNKENINLKIMKKLRYQCYQLLQESKKRSLIYLFMPFLCFQWLLLLFSPDLAA